jgi:TonB family protein
MLLAAYNPMASHSAVAAVRVAPESFLDWSAPDQPVSVSISLNLVDVLSLEMIEAFKAIPRRGLEIGGLLLGHVDTSGGKPVVVIEDRELLPSEHLHGPSFRLSSLDRDQLTSIALKWGVESNAGFHVVGLFRGDTRPEHKFDEQDVTLAKQLALEGQGVFLMIAPAVGHLGQATIGILKDGDLVPADSFPFRSASLREGAFPISDRNISPIATERRILPAPTPASSTPNNERGPRPAPPGRRVLDLGAYRIRSQSKSWQALWNRSRGRAWIPLSIGAAILSGVLLATLWRHVSHSGSASPSAAAVAPAPSLIPIHLNVKREGPEWNLTWNQASELIERADRGAIRIYDGPSSWELPLDRNELRTGSIRYLPKSGQVKFQLQIFLSNGSVSESIIALDSGYQPGRAQPVRPEPSRGAADRGPLSPQRSKKAKQDLESRHAPILLASRPPARASGHDVTALPEPPSLSSSPLVPPPGASLGKASSPDMRLPVTMLFEPAGASRIRKALKFVSPTRVVHHHEAAEAPATPLQEVKPDAPLQAAQGLQGSVEIDVRVAIDTHGKVSGAWLESGHDRGQLSDAAITAARNWRFKPAAKNHALVESEGVVHFRFQNPDVAVVAP